MNKKNGYEHPIVEAAGCVGIIVFILSMWIILPN